VFTRKERTLDRPSLFSDLSGETTLINFSSNSASVDINTAISSMKLFHTMGEHAKKNNGTQSGNLTSNYFAHFFLNDQLFSVL
jgi:hypothetical protein